MRSQLSPFIQTSLTRKTSHLGIIKRSAHVTHEHVHRKEYVRMNTPAWALSRGRAVYFYLMIFSFLVGMGLNSRNFKQAWNVSQFAHINVDSPNHPSIHWLNQHAGYRCCTHSFASFAKVYHYTDSLLLQRYNMARWTSDSNTRVWWSAVYPLLT